MIEKNKEPLLFLVHRIPYPPNKGDKIRSYHLLNFLSQYYDIYLGAFIDDPEDNQYRERVSQFCKGVYLESLNPLNAKIKSLSGLISRKALSIPYYSSKKMQHWVNTQIEKNNIKQFLAFSSPMAQFLQNTPDNTLKIMDFVDIDSDKWQQYCKTHKGLMSWIYAREADYLFDYEKSIAQQFSASLFVSQQEAQMFKEMCPEAAQKVYGISNGVDIDYFSPDYSSDSPYNIDKKVLVFTGAMDYWANCDAVIWFANKVFPILRKKNPAFEFYIVGSKPTEQVFALKSIKGVFVTGRVDDIRPFIKHAFLSVAPLRIARGIQNKVLEAMAMGKAVIATQNAVEGIKLPDNIEKLVSTSIAEQLVAIDQLKNNDFRKTIETASSQWIKDHYSWHNTLKPLLQLIKSTN